MTVSLSNAVDAVKRHIGLPTARIRTVARRLQEAGTLPLGAPGVAPVLTIDHVLDLVIALAADTPLHLAANAVTQYGALTPGGAVLSGAPQSIPSSARVVLDSLARVAAHGDGATELNIEFVSTWPEVALHWSDGKVQRFREASSLASTWADGRHRRSITITGAAFAGVFAELFGEIK